MKPDLENHRRVLLVMYRRYLRAERACRLAQREALSWFPARTRPSVRPIGDPGSHVRRLSGHRDKLHGQLRLAHQELTSCGARTRHVSEYWRYSGHRGFGLEIVRGHPTFRILT